MPIILKSPPKSKVKLYFINYFSIIIILTVFNIFFFKWYIAVIAVAFMSLYLPYSRPPSNRIIYKIEIDDENKTMTFYYYIIYKNKQKAIAFKDLKFNIDKTTELVSKKVKYRISFIKRNWPFGYIINHGKLMPYWSTDDIEFLIQFYNSNIKPEHKK